MREFRDVKKRDVVRAFETIRLAMTDRTDGMVDWSEGGNPIEQAIAVRLDETGEKAYRFLYRLVLKEDPRT